MSEQGAGAGQAGGEIIRVQVNDLVQLFNSIDPSPFRERDLDAGAEQFILAWARDLSSRAPLALDVRVRRPAGPSGETAAEVGEAVHSHFARKAATAGHDLRLLLRRGRISLLIGLVFLSACVTAGDLTARLVDGDGIGAIVREGLTAAGWVAMWRPMEIFLYAWWPIVGDRRLYDRLSRMPVRVGAAAPEDRPRGAPVGANL